MVLFRVPQDCLQRQKSKISTASHNITLSASFSALVHSGSKSTYFDAFSRNLLMWECLDMVHEGPWEGENGGEAPDEQNHLEEPFFGRSRHGMLHTVVAVQHNSHRCEGN